MEEPQMDELKELLLKLATIANQLELRNAESTRRIESSATVLEQGMGRLNAGAERFAHTMIDRVADGAQQAVARGLDAAGQQFARQVQSSVDTLKWATDALTEQRRLLSSAQKTLVWKGVAALMLASLLAAGGIGYAGWKARHDLAQSGLADAFLDATQSGALVRCGEQMLCARVGKKPQRFASQPDLAIVEMTARPR